jgi:hypothetical protein
MKARNITRKPLNIMNTQRATTRRRLGITKKDRMKRGGHHAHIAHGHHLNATHHAEEAAKAHSNQHSK